MDAITMTSWWARYRLKSPASLLFTQLFIKGAHQRKHQSSASLAFVRGIHRSPAQRAINAENVSIWWRHHACPHRSSNKVLISPCYSAITSSLYISNYSSYNLLKGSTAINIVINSITLLQWQRQKSSLGHHYMLICLFRYLVSTFRWMCVTRSISQRDFGSQLFKYMCCVIAIVYQICDVWGEESLNSTYKMIFGNNSGLYQCLQNREQLSSSLAFSEGSPWVPGEIQSWRPVQRSFDFPFAVSLTTLLNTLVNLPGDLRHLGAYAASMKWQKWYGMEVNSN